MTLPILQEVDETKSFCLKTAASNYALGAVLLQGEKDNEHPIEYASRLLLEAEKNYSTTEREALAVVCAVKKFRDYIEGSEISVLTDHQPQKWIFSLKSPTGRLARWALEFQPYNIQFGYMPGRQNMVADTLSKPPCHFENHVDVQGAIPKFQYVSNCALSSGAICLKILPLDCLSPCHVVFFIFIICDSTFVVSVEK